VGAITFSIDPRLVHCLKEALPISTFVETGTFKGDAVASVAAFVERSITIESSKRLWKEAHDRFAGADNIEVLLGDSATVLDRIAPSLRTTATLYWLDAHWCVADDTAGEHSQCPLLGEIAAIGRLNENSVVLIDDARLFLAPPAEPHEVTQWPTFDTIVRALRGLSSAHELAVLNDVIAFYPPAAHDALERYARKHGVDWLRAAQAIEENRRLHVALAEKEAELHAQHDARVAAERWLQQKERGLEEKEQVIQEMRKALGAYRLVFAPLGFFARPIARLIPLSAFRGLIPRPRLGTLYHHDPQDIVIPKSYSRAPVLAATPRISLVTPSFKQAAFIERTISSVLEQQYPNLEYYVQDGGSEDGTREILERHADRLAGWESRPDKGQSQAINLGFARTSGEIMAWLNSDDILLPGALHCVADFFNSNPDVDVIYGHRLLIDENDQLIGRWILPSHDHGVLSWADYVPQETLFWRRSIWEKVGGRIDESFRFAMDWDLLLRFRDAGARFVRIPRFLGGFRIHPHQKTSAAISDIGFEEMDRLRERALGRVPTHFEVRRAVMPYLLRHVACEIGWQIRGILGGHR
jgi:GT2 family glycosyltransferase